MDLLSPRVVHIYKSYPPVRGGIEGHIDLLTRLLVQRGCPVEVLCAAVPGAPAREERAEVAVRRCAAPLTLASTPLPPGLPWALSRSSARIVHLHYPWPPGELAWVLAGGGRPLVVTVHCEVVRHRLLGRLVGPLTRYVLRRAARIVVTGAWMAELPLLTPHRGRLRVIPLGVDLDWFRPAPPLGNQDPLPSVPRPRALFVGWLRYYKGLPVLAAALSRLPDVQLVVAGQGPERERFEAALRQHGVRQRAHLLGDVGDERLLSILQHADVAVLPSTSRAEAFGIAIAEAQACGVPAVTVEVGTGTAQAVADGESGRVVAAGDSSALAAAIRWCLDSSRAAGLRLAARRHAEANLCARRMADAVLRMYGEIECEAS